MFIFTQLCNLCYLVSLRCQFSLVLTDCNFSFLGPQGKYFFYYISFAATVKKKMSSCFIYLRISLLTSTLLSILCCYQVKAM